MPTPGAITVAAIAKGARGGILHALFDAMHEGLIILDASGDIITINEPAIRLFGFSGRGDASFRPEHLWNHVEFRDLSGVVLGSARWLLEKTLGEKRFSECVIEAVNLITGTRHILEWHGSTVGDEAGLPSVVMFSVRDVTREVHEKMEREHLLAELEAVFSAFPDGLVIHGKEGQITRLNPAAQRMLGYGPEDLACTVSARLQRTVALDGNGRPIPFDMMPTPRTLAGEEVHASIVQWPRGEQYVTVSVNGSPIRDATGSVRGAVLSLRDITERRKAQLERSELLGRLHGALEFSERVRAEWNALWNSMLDPMVILHEGNESFEANPVALKLIGVRSESEVCPEAILKHMFHQDGRPLSPGDPSLEAIRGGQRVENLPFRFISPSGKAYDFLISGDQIEAVSAAKRYMIIAHDVTELRRLERAKDEFLMVISHELRNPLQVIRGLSQIFRLKISAMKLTEALGRHMDMMDSQISQVIHLVDDILAAYRLSSGRFSIEISPLNLAQVVADAVAPFALGVSDHPIEIDLSCCENVSVNADARRLTEVLANLLSNAFKYSPNGAPVRISAQVSENDAIIRVEDEGIGIPEDHLERVFEGFHRIGRLSEWKSGGTGLGLYISRKLARLHGGDLWAENLEKGTRMNLKLPRLREALEE